MRVEDTAWFRYLAAHAPEYRAKLLEVRDEVKLWVAYIPQTFPHYTQHTTEHSEAIIGRLSKLLFLDDDPARPVVQLSGMEAYILAAAGIPARRRHGGLRPRKRGDPSLGRLAQLDHG